MTRKTSHTNDDFLADLKPPHTGRTALVNSLAYRQALTSVFVAFIIGTLLSATQVMYDWFQEKDRLESTIIQVMRTLEEPGSQALYTVDRPLAQIVVDGLFEYKTVYRAALVDDFGDVYAEKANPAPSGTLRDLFLTVSDSRTEYSIPLDYGPLKRHVGHLNVSLDIFSEMFSFFDRAIITFLSGMFRNFTLALCLIAAFTLTLVRPLKKLIGEIAGLEPGGLQNQVSIPSRHERSELGQLAENANRIFSLYEDNARSLNAVEQELRRQQEVLEKTVEERTAELQKINKKLSQLSQTDPLTELANRRSFDQTLISEWARGERTGQSLALAMIDVDHFKRFNDRYGHPAGDECLKQLAKIFTDQIKRSGDLVVRYGGEEFALILPSTGTDEAVALCENLRVEVEKSRIISEDAPSGIITISIGVAAALPIRENAPQHLIAEADRQLYRAKRHGRNQVIDARSTSGV